MAKDYHTLPMPGVPEEYRGPISATGTCRTFRFGEHSDRAIWQYHSLVLETEVASRNRVGVSYDSDIFLSQSRGGISRYFVSLIETFLIHPELEVDPSLTFGRSDNEVLRNSALGRELKPARAVPRAPGVWSRRPEILRETLVRYRAGRGSGSNAALLHATYSKPIRHDVDGHRKLAMTFFDLIPEVLGLTGKRDPHDGKYRLATRADVIFSISETTSRHINEYYPSLSAPVVTTPLAVDRSLFSPAEGEPCKDAPRFPYLLFVGKRGMYKDFSVLLRAAVLLRGRGVDVGLTVAGPALLREEWEEIVAVIPRDRFQASTPTDVELADLYRHAVAFVFPSRLEGFGLPILESMSCNCPVVLADTPVFREVGGEGALFFGAGDAEHLAVVLEELVESSANQMLAAATGQVNVARFSWAETARLTALGYRAALG